MTTRFDIHENKIIADFTELVDNTNRVATDVYDQHSRTSLLERVRSLEDTRSEDAREELNKMRHPQRKRGP